LATKSHAKAQSSDWAFAFARPQATAARNCRVLLPC
jgi:hypothetical protein